ncbi:MAG: exo-beta-N-acetylmuramidase NamZ family protein [Flammeovirgaceae bacterium]
MRYSFLFLLMIITLFACSGQEEAYKFVADVPKIKVGAARLDQYLPTLKDKKVALLVNQTSVIDSNVHLVDTLLALGIQVKQIFAPEHGFRGDADAGESVVDGKDKKTGLPILSLYGKNKKPSAAQLTDIDVVVFDIQDVGARFYTYISTMHYVMEACAEQQKQFMVLDRPNPNGHYVDGPVLELAHQSFVGLHPIPIVHGLTVGELAKMINGEGWLKGGRTCELQVISCEHYTHLSRYSLPIKPSPNLPNDWSIALYPSLCLFEGTTVSVGRGTDMQFQILGHPDYPDTTFSFTPVRKPGAKYPKHQNITCYGKDLRSTQFQYKFNFFLDELIHFYAVNPRQDQFFNAFFTKLAGTKALQQQIEQGISQDVIRQSWQPALQQYLKMRKKYLLYEDF